MGRGSTQHMAEEAAIVLDCLLLPGFFLRFLFKKQQLIPPEFPPALSFLSNMLKKSENFQLLVSVRGLNLFTDFKPEMFVCLMKIYEILLVQLLF